MPLFDFHCTACEADFEQLVRGDTVPVCKHCGSTAVERCVSLTSAQGTAKATIAAGRRLAASQGHLSNYSKADRARAK